MMNGMKQIILFVLLVISSSALARVVPDEQLWVNLNTFIRLKNDWQVYLEAQPRIIDYHSKQGTTLYRGAVGKSVGNGLSLWLGYGFIERTNPSYLHEDRPFAQVIHSKDIHEKIKLINRTRFEGRYFRDMSSAAWRLRHLLRAQYRFGGSRFGLVAYDEWFWNSASHNQSGIKEGFDQNRAFAGVSYAFGGNDEHLGEIGYMNQYMNRPTNDSSNDVLALQFTFRF